jgi:hypothetical protein
MANTYYAVDGTLGVELSSGASSSQEFPLKTVAQLNANKQAIYTVAKVAITVSSGSGELKSQSRFRPVRASRFTSRLMVLQVPRQVISLLTRPSRQASLDGSWLRPRPFQSRRLSKDHWPPFRRGPF